MVRVAHIALASLAIAVPLAAKVPSDRLSETIFEQGCVTRFYGVPLNLKLSELEALDVDYTRGFVSGEGDYYPAATLLVGRNVLLQAEFNTDEVPTLYQLTTSSAGAIGPGGVAIGSTLRDVRRKWPKGKFYWASAHGPYVAFTNGTNVYFEFDPREMPPGAFDPPPVPVQDASGKWVSPPRTKVVPDPIKLKVRSIRISNGNIFESCKKPDGKK